MKKVTQEIYDRIDNDLYHVDGDRWRQSDSALYLIQSSVNPARAISFTPSIMRKVAKV